MNPFRRSLLTAALLAAAGLAHAAEPIKIAILQELSGPGTTSGTNAKNGALLAIRDINAAGGILGHKIEATVADTQSNPGVAKGLAQKAV
ncbi:MAG: ABC transporter substrate-binding protein, partial [Burkholderiales bacterium]|nr:ABC transporter substrate-binding protein [Burkholderiales bacterium]